MEDPYSGASFAEGPQDLSGQETLAFSRNRHDTPKGDFGRSENQGRVLLAALDKLQSQFDVDAAALLQWIAVGSAHIQTDLPLDEVFQLMLTALTIDRHKVTNLVIPGSVGFAGDASVVYVTDGADDI